MNPKSLKAKIAIAMVALAAAGYAAPASAQGLHIEVRSGFFGHRVEADHWRGHRRGKFRRRHAVCRPHQAVRKARWLGLRRAGIRRVNRRVIVVGGVHRGHYARVVFARRSRHCAIVGARGI